MLFRSRMNSFSRAIRYSAPLMALVLAAPPLLAGGTTAHRTRLTAPKPVAADNAIIPLPLAPIVPAAQRMCAARTPSGLGYTMLRAGAGTKPAGDATVLVNYIGYLAATGAVFDQGMQTPMPVGQVIPGFGQGLQLLGKGGIVRDESARQQAVERVRECVIEQGGSGIEVIDSPIRGMEGNHEYLLHAYFGERALT